MAEKQKYPMEHQISEKVRARIGFRDGRVEILVKTGIPFVGEVTLTLEPGDIPAVEQVVANAKKWLAKKELERFLEGAE